MKRNRFMTALTATGIVFDAPSRFLAVTTFDHFNDWREGGSIDFWQVLSDPLDLNRLGLVNTAYSVRVMCGVHSLVLVP